MRNNPIIALIDMDCFYVQVELNDSPLLKGKPSAVVQYNTWRGGSIIAVSYEARDKGVTRGMRGDEAKEKCPEIHLFSVPELRGKADLTRYRSAGADVIKCLSNHAGMVERASVDEAYIDLTDEVDNLLIAAPEDDDIQLFWRREQDSSEGCHSVGYESYELWLDHVVQSRATDQYNDDVRLALASFLVKKMRDDVFATLGYSCSAGIAHSKVTAKYACGVHKPNQQTTVSANHVSTLFSDASIQKIRNLGGKMGKIVQDRLHVETMGQLTRFTLAQLTESFGDRTGPWLYSLCRGQDDEGVISRQLAQSIGCSKTFPGVSQLDTLDKVRHWVESMSQEIVERIDHDRSSNGRVPSHLCVNYRQLRAELSKGSKRSISGSRVVPLGKLTIKDIAGAALVVLAGINNAGHRNMTEQSWYPPLLSLGLSAGKFRPQVAKNDISRFLIDAPMNSAAIVTTKMAHNSLTMESASNSLSGEKSLDQDLRGEDSSTNKTLEEQSLVHPQIKEEETGHCRKEQEIREEILTGKNIVVPQIEREGIGGNGESAPIKGFFARRFEREEKERQSRYKGIMDEEVEEVEEEEEVNMWNESNDEGFFAQPIEDRQRQIGRNEDKDTEEEAEDETEDEAEQSRPKGFFAQRIERENLQRQEMAKQREQTTPSSSAITNSDYIKCEHCGQLVSMWEAPEHMDWHVARQVQKDLNREIMDEVADKRRAANEAKKKLTTVNDHRNNTGKSLKRKAKEAKPNQRTIDSFFAK